ncbi:hypothetical protein [Nonomuraea turcica]|nr:hypothetical protein [Nonomuraea sp. G32]MDP4504041.1 hypothetical protein [Nonomuraea sp. G32]
MGYGLGLFVQNLGSGCGTVYQHNGLLDGLVKEVFCSTSGGSVDEAKPTR